MTRQPTEDDDGPVRFMQQHIALDYVMRVSPLAAALRRAASNEGAIVGPPLPVVRRWCTCRPGLLPDLRGGDGPTTTRSR